MVQLYKNSEELFAEVEVLEKIRTLIGKYITESGYLHVYGWREVNPWVEEEEI